MLYNTSGPTIVFHPPTYSNYSTKLYKEGEIKKPTPIIER